MWECCVEVFYFVSEIFLGGILFKLVFNGNFKFQIRIKLNVVLDILFELYKVWNMIYKEYFGKIFSYVQDRFVVLLGFVQEFEVVLLDDMYLVGIWCFIFLQLLLWQFFGDLSFVGLMGSYFVLIWFWLLIFGFVFLFVFDYSGGIYFLVDIVDVIIILVFLVKFIVFFKDVFIIMCCFMCFVEVCLDYEKKFWYMFVMGGGKIYKLLIKEEDGMEVFCVSNFYFDVFDFLFDIEWDQDMENGLDVVVGYFVLLIMRKFIEYELLCICGFLVEFVGDGLKVIYKCIGFLIVYGFYCQRVKYMVMYSDKDEVEQKWDYLLKCFWVIYESFEKLKDDKEEDFLECELFVEKEDFEE